MEPRISNVALTGVCEELQQLLGIGANVAHRDAKGTTALHSAAAEGHGGVVTTLGPSRGYGGGDGCTPLPLACAANADEAVVGALLRAGANEARGSSRRGPRGSPGNLAPGFRACRKVG